MSNTARHILESSDDWDCTPLFEAIVAQKFIIDLWAQKNEHHQVYQSSSMMFLDTTHEGKTLSEMEMGPSTWGETISYEVFFDYADALTWVFEETRRLTILDRGGLDHAALAP
jgi:hypothetical protein